MKLSKVQKEAVQFTKKPLLVCAGAGSGKSRVLTHKYAHLIKKGYSVDKLLCITFTNKAANTLKERVVQLVGHTIRFPWVRTIHSACLQMLRPSLDLIGYNKNTSVFGTPERKKLISKILKDNNLHRDKKNYWDVNNFISHVKNQTNAFEYLKGVENGEIEFETSTLPQHRLVPLFYEYMDELRKNNALDYDDIIFYTYFLLTTNEQFRKFWCNYFQYILIDEYQDINAIQNEIFRILNNNQSKITVVGDDYQSIFLWRYAEPKYFIKFKDYYENAHIIFMERNYRSTKSIVKTSNVLIKNNKFQLHKNTYSKIKSNVKPAIVRHLDNEKEAKQIVKNCKQFIEKYKCRYSDIAILFRVRSISRVIESELLRNKIPYKVIGTTEFFERREISAVTSYLSFLNNLKDTVSFEKLITCPRFGLGPLKLKQFYKQPGEDLADKIIYCLKNQVFSKKINSNFNRILNLISERKNPPSQIINNIASSPEFTKYLESISVDQDEFYSRRDNITELFSMANDFNNLNDFSNELKLLSDKKDNKDDCVNLLTIHSAKGLEFRFVFVIGLENGILPHYLSKNSQDTFEEERRLLYVAITRAEEFLLLSYCDKRNFDNNKMSPFLHEIRKQCNFFDLRDESKPRKKSKSKKKQHKKHRKAA